MTKFLRAMLRVLGLEKLLVLLVAGLVALAVAVVAASAVSRLERMAREETIARAKLAGASAAEVVSRMADETLVSARLLAERPTLRRLVESRDLAALVPFIDRFRETSGLSGCAVLRDDAIVVQVGVPLPWTEIAQEQGAHEGRFLSSTSSDSTIVLGASAAVPALDGTSVLVARLLDEEAAQKIAAQTGHPIELLSRGEVLRSSENPRQALRRRGIEWEETQVGAIPDAGIVAVVAPLRAPGGEIIGVAESSIDEREASASVRRFAQWVALISIGVALLGALGGALIARRLVAPVERLTQASARIGRGDLATPIPRIAGREVGALASTMEEMRSKLLRLMAELRRRRAEADSILGGIAEGVFSVDSERRIRYMNPQAAAALGINVDGALGRFCGDVLRPVDALGHRPCEESCPIVHARFRGTATATEHLITHDGGRRTVVITSAAPLSDVGRSGRSGPGSGTSAGDPGRNSDRVGAANARRDPRERVARVPHAARGAARIASSCCATGFRTSAPTRRASWCSPSSAARCGSRSSSTICWRVCASRRGNIPFAASRSPSTKWWKRPPTWRRRSSRSAGKCSRSISRILSPVTGDRDRLLQVFVNLLGNANKFSPAGSTIRVGGETQEGAVTLWVEDEGTGWRRTTPKRSSRDSRDRAERSRRRAAWGSAFGS